MEAVPRLPMLSFEPKPFFPKNAQFGPDLMNLIRQHYQEDPNNYLEEVQQLEKLRQQASKLNKDIDGINILKRYFCQLYFLQKRFPMLKEVSVGAEISWKDLLSSSSSRKVDYRSEFTTTLYNIGVLHTQLGAADDRTTADGLKLACTHFQCAAWAFQYLREVTSVNVRPDFDHGFLEFLISTCLAQAQECIAEKSITDNRKPSISAKVVTQICEYYESAKHALSRLIQEDSILIDYGLKNPQGCMNYLRYKQPYYRCIANLFLGMQAEEDEKMGERVAYFDLASDELKEAFRYVKEIPANKSLDEALSFTHDVVEGKKKSAVNENEFIYHEEVPPKDSLQRVKGAALVKCIGFDFNDPEISGTDIFSKLISMKVHQLSSVYSEEKAKLLRGVSSSVEEKESELNSFMQSFKFDYLNATEDPNSLPEELIERCAACEAKPTIVQDLVSSMNKLADAHHEVEYMMKEVLELIEEEEKAEEEYQIVMGTNRPPSIVATDLKCEANRYQEALKKATESNESLRNAISAHVNNLRILSLPLDELEKQLPRVSLDYSPEERSIVNELQRLVDKVDEMKNQRALLMLQLRDSLRNDDITEQIALSDDDRNEFSHMVDKEITKHKNVVTLIEQNLKAQSNILKAVTNAYASYAPIRKIILETAHKRGVQINALIESFDVSDDVLKKTTKGLEFYRKLDVNVRKLLNRVKGTCKVQEEERFQMYSKEGKKLPRKNQKVVPDSVVAANNEKPVPSSTPKLKDYIGQKSFNKTVNEVPLPYNPYYNAPVSAYVSSVARNLDDSRAYPVASSTTVDVNQYFSSVSRPPPVGSETTVMPAAKAEPFSDSKNTISSAATPVGYSTYNYAYHGNPNSTYQPPPAPSVATNTQPAYPGTYSVQGAYSQGNVPATNHQSYNYGQTMYSTPQHKVNVTQQPITDHSASNPNDYNQSYANYATVTGNVAVVHPGSNVQNGTVPNPGVAYTSGTTYVPTAYPYAGTTTANVQNTYPTSNMSIAYQASGYNAAGSVQNMYSSANVPTSYSTSAYTSASTANVVTNAHYSATNTPMNIYGMNASQNSFSSNSSVYDPVNIQTGDVAVPNRYNSTYPTATGYITNHQAPILDGQNSPKHAYNQGVTNTYTQHNYYAYPGNYNANYGGRYDTPNYQNANTVAQQPQVSDVQNTDAPSFVSAGVLTTNTSQYTSAGHHNTQNIESSSVCSDGRSYAIQYAVSGLTTPTLGDNQLYYSSQYGHQYSETKAGEVTNEHFVSRENEPGDRLQAKRNSMTYIQAGSAGNNNTTSTFSVNGSNSASTEKKQESNLDLLADLDFEVCDTPLLPISEAAAANKIIEKLTHLNLNAVAGDKKNTSILEERLKTGQPRDPFSDKEYLSRFVQDAEKFETFVEKLTVTTLNGSVPLNNLWNEYIEQQEKFSKIQSIAEAQKHSDKNRSASAVPYDNSRVVLSSTESSYINASLIKNLNPCVPDIIVTQSPLVSTVSDFWCMIWDQEVELVVCLLTEKEMSNDVYWPKEKNEKLEINYCTVTLHSVNNQAYWIERVFSLLKDNITRIVIHIQISSWREELFSKTSNPLTDAFSECISFYYAQRDLHHGVVVHCDTGVGRSGIFVMLISFICEINSGKGISDLMAMLKLVSEGRRNIIRDEQHLLSMFQLALSYVQRVLVKYGKRVVPEPPKEPVKVESGCNTEAIINTSSSFKKVSSSSEIKQHDRLLSKEENKKRNMERFSVGGTLESLTDCSVVESNDPLSSIDPMWPITKKQG